MPVKAIVLPCHFCLTHYYNLPHHDIRKQHHASSSYIYGKCMHDFFGRKIEPLSAICEANSEIKSNSHQRKGEIQREGIFRGKICATGKPRCAKNKSCGSHLSAEF